MKKLVVILAVFYSLACSADEQASAAQQLSELLASYQTLTFSFRQKITNSQGLTLDEASGQALLASPNKIRWETTDPYPQLLISDGRVVWLYDSDLLQATRRAVSDKPTDAPALLLLSGRQALTQYFRVSLLETYDTWIWFSLVPKEKAVHFDHIEIGFSAGVLYQMVIQDHSLQRVIFLLDDVRLNSVIADNRFDFIPPEGVEVIDEVGASLVLP